MCLRVADLKAYLRREPAPVLVRVSEVKGSAPREEGTFMLVGPALTLGTIGGGQLEFMAIDAARKMLARDMTHDMLRIPLGPDIGQCCGGSVTLRFDVLTKENGPELFGELRRAESGFPHVYLFGAGHVGRALALALAPLPLSVHLVETRPELLDDLPETIDTIASAMPEATVRSAPGGSAFVILTHDHALDFLIAREALDHSSASYVGMIGSKTKRAKFKNWYLGEGGRDADFVRLVCPIAGDKVAGKQPEVIAALAAAEILVHTRSSGEREISGGHSDAGVAGGADVR